MLLKPHLQLGAIPAEWETLAEVLVKGDGLGWPGDPHLWLGVGVIEDKRTGRVARRLEVWRANEDGSSAMIGHWPPDAANRVCYDLARMRVEAPGHVPVEERIDAHNAAMEAAKEAEFADVYGEALDHAARLFHDTNNPRTRFYT